MKNFAGTQHCRLRVHCPACRTDTAWRQSVGAPDDCPHGVIRQRRNDLPPVRDVASIVAGRLAICNACDDRGCGIKHQTACRCKAILGREHFHCPNELF